MNRKYIGQVCIRKGNENQEPAAVFVSGINSFQMLICRVINSGSLVMSEPDEEGELIDFDYKTLEVMRAEWFVENAERQVMRSKQYLNEVKGIKGASHE
ncbi:TPA: hypothetical protein SLF30_000479 [Acinetobacter baumannii]|nr:hypothetical protein [Acinetobacter baumannii]